MVAVITLDTLPRRISPGLAYFARKNEASNKGKGKQRADSELNTNADIENSSGLLSKLLEIQAKKQGDSGNANKPPCRISYSECNDSQLDGSAHEELVWHASTLVWSCGSAIHRMYTFNEEADNNQSIRQALFVWLKVPAPLSAPSGSSPPEGVSPETITVPPPPLSASSSSSASSSNDHLYGPFATPRPPPWSDDNRSSLIAESLNASLTSTALVRVVCVLFREQMHLFYPDGSHHILQLRLPIRKAWPLEQGLLLEREKSPNLWESIPEWLRAGKVSTRVQRAEPSLYVLLDPFCDFTPVSKVSAVNFPPTKSDPTNPSIPYYSIGSPTNGQAIPFSDPDERILYSSARRRGEEPIIISANLRLGKVSIWAYAHITEDTETLLDKARRKQFLAMEAIVQHNEPLREEAEIVGGNNHVAAANPSNVTGKRRRSADSAMSPTAPTFHVESGPGQRRISTAAMLLDRRLSNNRPSGFMAMVPPAMNANSNTSVTEFLEAMGTVPATGPSFSSSSTVALAAARRTSTAGSVFSTAPYMDRRTSTTRNELSISLDRMALSSGFSMPLSSVGTTNSMAFTGAPATEGDILLPQSVAPSDMEREVSLVLDEERQEEASELVISRLASTILDGLP